MRSWVRAEGAKGFTEPGRKIRGTVVRVALEPSGGLVRRVYAVVVQVDNADGTLRPGMRGTARFAAGEVPPVRQVAGWFARILSIDFWV